MRKPPSGLRPGLLRAQIAPLACVLEPSAAEPRFKCRTGTGVTAVSSGLEVAGSMAKLTTTFDRDIVIGVEYAP